MCVGSGSGSGSCKYRDVATTTPKNLSEMKNKLSNEKFAQTAASCMKNAKSTQHDIKGIALDDSIDEATSERSGNVNRTVGH